MKESQYLREVRITKEIPRGNDLMVIVIISILMIMCGCTGEGKVSGKLVSEVYGSGYGNWKEAYATYIKESSCEEKGYHYALIYLDEDEKPELYVETNCSAGGEQVLCYHEDKLHILQLGRIGSKYIPNKGLIYNNCGHMDYYPVYIYELYEGDFYLIGEGMWGGLDWEKGPELNEDGEPDYQFEWEGKRYTEENFYAEIDKIFPMDEGICPSEWYPYDEMWEMLSSSPNRWTHNMDN